MEKSEMMNAPITNLAQPTTTNVPTENQTVEETERKDEWQWEGSEEEAEYLEFQRTIREWLKDWDENESSDEENSEEDDVFLPEDDDEDEEEEENKDEKGELDKLLEDTDLVNPFSSDGPFGKMDSSDTSELEKPSVTDQFGDKRELRVEMLPLLENPEAELDKMLGCEEIRQQIEKLTALTRYNAQLKKIAPDIPPHKVSLHAIFQGAPGTGKTTLCKIYASMLHKAGALSRGHVVVANRSTFIGTRWGDEEVAVAETLKAAKGGVLMIDEAYQLVTKHPNDPGRLILQLMMPMLADEQNRDIAVVLCGYKGLIQELLDQNEGLRSRFVNVFNFPEFSVQQLLEISRRRYRQYQYHFTRQAWMRYREIIRKGYDQRDKKTWGNARFVANLLDEVYVHHAQRITGSNITDRRQFLTITAADIKPVTLPLSTVTPKIGF